MVSPRFGETLNTCRSGDKGICHAGSSWTGDPDAPVEDPMLLSAGGDSAVGSPSTPGEEDHPEDDIIAASFADSLFEARLSRIYSASILFYLLGLIYQAPVTLCYEA